MKTLTYDEFFGYCVEDLAGEDYSLFRHIEYWWERGMITREQFFIYMTYLTRTIDECTNWESMFVDDGTKIQEGVVAGSVEDTHLEQWLKEEQNDDPMGDWQGRNE